MYDIAKKARAGMKSKAERLAGEKDRKTDSSDWSPAPALNADVKTGMRPVSRRAYKKGGAVKGDVPKQRADRAPRKAGGRVAKNDGGGTPAKKYINVGGKKVEDTPEAKLANLKKTFPNATQVTKEGHPDWEKMGYKSGGKVETKGEQPLVDRYINRDLKKANEYRDGKKHDGGLKRGGRAKKQSGGAMGSFKNLETGKQITPDEAWGKSATDVKKPAPKAPTNATTAVPTPPNRKYESIGELIESYDTSNASKKPAPGMKKGGKVADKACYGGRMKKNDGGPAQVDPRLGIVKPKAMEFGQNVVVPGLKKGGRVKKDMGGLARSAGSMATQSLAPVPAPAPAASPMAGQIPTVGSGLLPPQASPVAAAKIAETPAATKSPTSFRDFMLKGLRDAYSKKTGKTFPLKDGGRTAKASGGALMMGGKPKAKSAKGKTNINIIIATGKANKPEETPMAPMGAGAPPVVPPAAMMGAGAPPPMGGPAMPPMGPPPAPMGAGKPPMPMPPMPRKAGGRVTKIAKSYKDMEAGAGSGEGRLQKTDIAKRAPHKAGGKVYRSYKDMDAGAGSGTGRLEKTEIQSRKK